MLEGAVEHELGCGTKAARDTGKDGELCARDVRKDEGKGDGRVLARLAACVAGGVRLEGLRRG